MAISALEKALRAESDKAGVTDDVIKTCRGRARAMLAKLRKYNPKQAELVLDPAPHVSGICPRRAGKSYAGAAAALITGEAKPGSISIIISLNLKQLRRLYWKGSPSGLWAFNEEFGLNLKFNSGNLSWEHENGSIGYLLGAENDDQIESMRGMEADLYLIDECKSFAPMVLETIVDDIIDPQRSSRNGRIIMIGTPGFITTGPFYEATCVDSRDQDGRPRMLPYGQKDPYGRTADEDLLWSCHAWTLQENTAKPRQWLDAVKKKKQKRWADDHPTWMREYLGRWTSGGDGLVFRYGAEKSTGRVCWVPEVATDNPAGLPANGAPWRFIGGLDIGYEAPTAFVICAYSARLRQLRHVWDCSRQHLLVPDLADMINEAQDRFGPIEKIFADAGNLGKTIIETLIQQYGLPLERADKREKLDYIELMNGAFASGEVLVVTKDTAAALGWDSSLEIQLLTNVWDLRDEDKATLARLGRLREDKNVPNDTTDAFVYLYRGSLHHFGVKEREAQPEPGSPAAVKAWEKAQLRIARLELRNEDQAHLRNNGFDKAPRFVRRALKATKWIPATPSKTSTRTSYERSLPS